MLWSNFNWVGVANGTAFGVTNYVVPEKAVAVRFCVATTAWTAAQPLRACAGVTIPLQNLVEDSMPSPMEEILHVPGMFPPGAHGGYPGGGGGGHSTPPKNQKKEEGKRPEEQQSKVEEKNQEEGAKYVEKVELFETNSEIDCSPRRRHQDETPAETELQQEPVEKHDHSE